MVTLSDLLSTLVHGKVVTGHVGFIACEPTIAKSKNLHVTPLREKEWCTLCHQKAAAHRRQAFLTPSSKL